MSAPISMAALQKGYLAYREEIDVAIRRVLESGWYILGREVAEFEEAFARWCGVHHAIGVGNGTDALVIALRALDVGPGDAVFTVSHTAVATIAAVEMTGATPVLVDIDPETHTLDPARLEEAVAHFTRSGTAGEPKAVIAVHIYGHPCHMDAIRNVCDRHGLKLLEDCAQAHGATIRGRRVGTFGDIAAYSFYPTKNLGAFGDGGAVVTADSALAERCRALRQYGWFRHHHSDIAGVNSRLDEIQAAILSVRLRHLDTEIAVRRSVAAQYDVGLVTSVTVPHIASNVEHAYHLYVVRTKARDSLSSALKDRGVASAIHYPLAVHQQHAYAGRVLTGVGGLPVTERLYAEILSLPMHAFLSQSDVVRVINAVRTWSG